MEDNDVIKVVRCKNCIWATMPSKNDKHVVCTNNQYKIQPRDGFCHNGRRRKSDDQGEH